MVSDAGADGAYKIQMEPIKIGSILLNVKGEFYMYKHLSALYICYDNI